jgi:fructose-bisphosphate aldolase class I
VSANAHALGRYAALCQEREFVPIGEPEVLMDGSHTIERCEQVTGDVLHAVFHALFEQDITLEAMLLKPNMVLAGKTCSRQASVPEVTTAALRCLRRHVPPALEAWHGREDNLAAGQRAPYHRGGSNGAARVGKYMDEMEAASQGADDPSDPPRIARRLIRLQQ